MDIALWESKVKFLLVAKYGFTDEQLSRIDYEDLYWRNLHSTVAAEYIAETVTV